MMILIIMLYGYRPRHLQRGRLRYILGCPFYNRDLKDVFVSTDLWFKFNKFVQINTNISFSDRPGKCWLVERHIILLANSAIPESFSDCYNIPICHYHDTNQLKILPLVCLQIVAVLCYCLSMFHLKW